MSKHNATLEWDGLDLFCNNWKIGSVYRNSLGFWLATPLGSRLFGTEGAAKSAVERHFGVNLTGESK